MIIFGFKSYVTLLATLNLVCPNCHNPAAHRLHKAVRKFTLFFVPLFPVSTKHFLDCTFCGLQRQLTKEEAEQLLASGGQQGYVQPAPQQSGYQQSGYQQPQQSGYVQPAPGYRQQNDPRTARTEIA